MPLELRRRDLSSAAAGLHYAHERRGRDRKAARHRASRRVAVEHHRRLRRRGEGASTSASRRRRCARSRRDRAALKGKVSYMSPEQCKGEATSIGAATCSRSASCSTSSRRRRACSRATATISIMDAIVNGKVPLPRVKRPDLPNDLSSIIMRALAVDPARRYPDRRRAPRRARSVRGQGKPHGVDVGAVGLHDASCSASDRSRGSTRPTRRPSTPLRSIRRRRPHPRSTRAGPRFRATSPRRPSCPRTRRRTARTRRREPMASAVVAARRSRSRSVPPTRSRRRSAAPKRGRARG